MHLDSRVAILSWNLRLGPTEPERVEVCPLGTETVSARGGHFTLEAVQASFGGTDSRRIATAPATSLAVTPTLDLQCFETLPSNAL